MNSTKVRMRLGWVQLYEETQDAGYVCRRCGISRPTLRKWYRRYLENGLVQAGRNTPSDYTVSGRPA